MRHSIPSPKQHRRPLPSLLSESYSMAQGFHPSILRLTILHNDPAAPQETCPSRTPGTLYLSRLVWATTFNFFYTYLTYCTTNKLFELKFILCTISRLRRYHDSWKCGGSFEARQTAEAVVYCGFESDFSPHVTDQGREGILLIRLEKNIWIILEMIMFFFLNRGKSWNKFAFRPSHLGVLTE